MPSIWVEEPLLQNKGATIYTQKITRRALL